MLLRNQQFEAADFDQQTLDRFLQYVVWLNKIDKEMESYREAAVTPTLKTSSDWLKFECQVDTQLQTYHSSVLKHSLRYVIRPQAGVTDEMLDADYPLLDADLYVTAALTGPQYQADNEHVMELLTAWLGSTDWWTFTSGGRCAKEEGAFGFDYVVLHWQEQELHLGQTFASARKLMSSSNFWKPQSTTCARSI
jgi:hypothetical protein